MKYKFLPIFALALATSSIALANEPIDKKPPRQGYQKFDSWFASAHVGAQSFVGDHDKQESFGKRITPNFGVSVGKWIDGTNFGARVNVNGGSIKGLTQNTALAINPENGYVIGDPHRLYDQKFNYIHAHADLLFHWSNDAYGVDLGRFYNVIPYAGVGVMSAINQQKVTKLSVNVGAIQSLRITDNWDINLDIKGNIVGDKFDGEIGGNNFEGRVAATIGLTYSFR